MHLWVVGDVVLPSKSRVNLNPETASISDLAVTFVVSMRRVFIEKFPPCFLIYIFQIPCGRNGSEFQQPHSCVRSSIPSNQPDSVWVNVPLQGHDGHPSCPTDGAWEDISGEGQGGRLSIPTYEAIVPIPGEGQGGCFWSFWQSARPFKSTEHEFPSLKRTGRIPIFSDSESSVPFPLEGHGCMPILWINNFLTPSWRRWPYDHYLL